MGQTKYFGLSFFDFGDNLTTTLNVQKEIDRFVVIDKQLYGLYQIFGNGVISGWEISDNGYSEANGISISIGVGTGIIGSMACQTDMMGTVDMLPTNATVHIYANLVGSTSFDRGVSFSYSRNIVSFEKSIRIGSVTTLGSSILYIDNSVRDLIGFERIVEEQINQHKHRGTPSKIDLKEEVKNQLPGARIEAIDASKITRGKFSIDRIPIVDHNELSNNGRLTHAQLDSFVQTLSQENKELLGEISTTNLLKTIIFLKYLYPTIDDYFVNELVMIPGIGNFQDLYDEEFTTAIVEDNISADERYIRGVSSDHVITYPVVWDTTYAFDNYTSITADNMTATIPKGDSFAGHVLDMVIINDAITLNNDGTAVEQISDFSDGVNSFIPHQEQVSGTIVGGVFVDENGNRVAGWDGLPIYRNYYTYYFNSPEDPTNLEGTREWSGQFDNFLIKVSNTTETHNELGLYFININDDGEEVIVGDFTLLNANEVTSGFVEKRFNISDLSLTHVSKIVLWTNASGSNFDFYIDDIKVIKEDIYSEKGKIIYRYYPNNDNVVLFDYIDYDMEAENGTSASVKVKIAESVAGLDTASYVSTSSLDAGSDISTYGSAIQIEVEMYSDSEHQYTPVLRSLEVGMKTSGSEEHFQIDTETDFRRGTYENITILSEDSGEELADLVISDHINVNGMCFACGNGINEMDNVDNLGSSITDVVDERISILGFSGKEMPISPNQTKNWNSFSAVGFSTVSSVERLFNKTYLIADTYNNRVVEVDTEGNLIKGLGSSYSADSTLYPLSLIYNLENRLLTMVFTKSVTISDITKIVLNTNGVSVSLTESDLINIQTISSNKILKLTLDEDTAVRLRSAQNDLYISFNSGAFTETIDNSKGEALRTDYGYKCFVGDFEYIDNIRHPIAAIQNSKENWVICNSSIHYEDLSQEDTSEGAVDIIEIDPLNSYNTIGKMSYNIVKFSDFSLGGIVEVSEDKYYVAGFVADSNSLFSISGSDLTSSYSGEISYSTAFRAAAVDAMNGQRGVVYFIDHYNGSNRVSYSCPDGLFASDVDICVDGQLLIAESSFYNSSGRLIKVNAYGNITWSYGNGTYNIINDAKMASDSTILIST